MIVVPDSEVRWPRSRHHAPASVSRTKDPYRDFNLYLGHEFSTPEARQSAKCFVITFKDNSLPEPRHSRYLDEVHITIDTKACCKPCESPSSSQEAVWLLCFSPKPCDVRLSHFRSMNATHPYPSARKVIDYASRLKGLMLSNRFSAMKTSPDFGILAAKLEAVE